MAQSFDTTIDNLVSGVTGSIGPVDVKIGSVLRDGFLAPVAFEFTNAYSSLDTVSANQGVLTAAQQSDANLENLAANFGISRFVGSYASTTVRFYRYTQPTSTIPIPIGTKVYTELSTSRVAFSTLATIYMTPTSPTDPITGAYYVDCAVMCDDIGTAGNVIAGAISYVEIVGIDAVTNLNDATGGNEAQTNQQLVSSIQSTARGNSGTKTGYEALVRTNFSVGDVKIIAGRDYDAVRSQYGGSIDIIVLGEDKTPMTETFVYVDALTTTMLLPTFKPLMEVTQITAVDSLGDSVVLVEGTDYDVILDTYSVNRRSVNESSKILLHPSMALLDASLITVQYMYSALVASVQAFMTDEANYVFGSDVLVKLGIPLPANVTANIRILPGYSSTTVVTSVEQALSDHFNALLLDGDVQASDVITTIGAVAGVDSVDLPTFSFALASAPGVPLQQISANRQQYVRLNEANITVIG